MATKKTVSKKAPVKKVVKEKAPKGEYSVSIKVNGFTWKTTAESVSAALGEFLAPTSIKTDVTITVKKGKRSNEMLLNTFNARRLFKGSNSVTALVSGRIEKFLNG